MIDRVYFRVYTKAAWANAWQQRQDLSPISATRAAAPATGKAVFRRLFGYGRYEDGTPISNGTLMDSLAGLFVRLTRCSDAAGSNETLLFCGVFPAEGYDLAGQSAAGVKTAGQDAVAVELDWMLGRRIDTAWVFETSLTPYEIGWVPDFNRRSRTGAILGNKSGAAYTLADGIQSHVFENADYDEASPWAVWSDYDILLYLTHWLPTDIPMTLSIPASEIISLQSMQAVWRFDGKSLRQCLNELISPQRGLSWAMVVGLDDSVVIKIFSLLDTAITVGDVTLAAHAAADRITPNLWTDSNSPAVQIEADRSLVVDTITVRGSRIKTCCSFSFADETLEADWTVEDQVRYKQAANGYLTGYAGLTYDEQAQVNDQFRACDRMGKVFAAFRVPKDWNWTNESGYEVNPQWDPVSGTFSVQAGPRWSMGKAFLAHLPFLEGHDYSGEAPVSHNDAATNPGYRRLFAFVQRDGKYYYADRLTPYAMNVRPHSDQLGVEIQGNPNHLLALNHWDGEDSGETSVGEPTALADMDETAVDYTTLIVTAMLETDQVFSRSVTVGSGTGRDILIDAPQAELWIAVKDTIVDIGTDGELVKIGSASLIPAGAQDIRILRDDTVILDSLLAAAQAWYGRPRYLSRIVYRTIDATVQLGTMLMGVGTAVGHTYSGVCVTAIDYEFTPGALRTTYSTDIAPLDLGGLFGQSSRSSGASAMRSEIAIVRNEITQIRTALSAVPVRHGQTVGGTITGGGGTSLLKAYCKEDAGSGNVIAAYLGYDELNVQIWTAAATFNTGDLATTDDPKKYWLSKIDSNTNNTPAEDANWTEITAYDETHTYNITTDPWCLYDNKLFRSLNASNTGHTPTEGAYWTTKAPAWSSATTYSYLGMRVTHSSKLWRSILISKVVDEATVTNLDHEPGDAGDTGWWEEITAIDVYCDIAGGTALQYAFPLLYEQQMLRVEYVAASGRYEAATLFAAAEETAAEGGLLEVVNEMLVNDIATGATATDYVNAEFAGHGLQFTAAANSTYVIEVAIIYSSAQNTGIALKVDGPASKVIMSGCWYGFSAGAAGGGVFKDYLEAVTLDKTIAGPGFVRGDMILQTGATAGQFIVKFASPDSGQAVTVLTGSNIKHRRTQWELPPS
jgi:hypothetical protein